MIYIHAHFRSSSKSFQSDLSYCDFGYWHRGAQQNNNNNHHYGDRDNDEDAVYKVVVKTGKQKNADTNARVYIRIKGSQGTMTQRCFYRKINTSTLFSWYGFAWNVLYCTVLYCTVLAAFAELENVNDWFFISPLSLPPSPFFSPVFSPLSNCLYIAVFSVLRFATSTVMAKRKWSQVFIFWRRGARRASEGQEACRKETKDKRGKGEK